MKHLQQVRVGAANADQVSNRSVSGSRSVWGLTAILEPVSGKANYPDSMSSESSGSRIESYASLLPLALTRAGCRCECVSV